MLPSGSLDALPFSVVLLVGNVILILLPALATGAWLGAALTVTVTLELLESPWLSVTVSVNMYVPCVRLVTAVEFCDGWLMEPDAGPLVFDQA